MKGSIYMPKPFHVIATTDENGYPVTIKAEAFIVIFERAKSSPLTRQPDFMHK